ncbi:MAG: histidine--tRNA ligase [Catonella sp.]|uniref:histidine--tRNA ligase n=1 Tax=Catonella sp. TaxID=2382125 RepID=UPI003FA081CB
MITNRPRGTQDWFGENMWKRTKIETIARELCNTYNIGEIITPAFEHTVLFNRSVGDTTDVVQKEMYTFKDKGNREISLKPEGTAGTIRAYLENNLYALPQPIKMFYFTQAFRYERPQSGRLRQHHQFGVEFVGSPSPMVEVELITLINEFIRRIGLKDVKLHINSIGYGKCRQDYNDALLGYLRGYEPELCEDCKERMKKNPLRVIDCKVPSCKSIVEKAPRTIEFLDEECREHFDTLQKMLTELGIPFEIDTGIVRGLDYYTKTVFEFVDKDGFTLCGGGRYDGLINEIDGKQNIPAVGFGMGIERILYFLEKEGVSLGEMPRPKLYVGMMGEEVKAKAFEIVTKLRNKGIIVETDYLDRSVKAQMKYANKLGADYTVIIGLNEIESGIVRLKQMETGEETEIKLEEIEEKIGKG